MMFSGPENHRRLRVLVLDEWIPFPPDSGKRTRTWNLLRRLAQRHDVTLLCYGDPRGEPFKAVSSEGIEVQTVPPLRRDVGLNFYGRLFLNLFSRYPYSVVKHSTRRYRDRLLQLLFQGQFDLIHCEWTPYARFLGAAEGLPTLIMAHNVESQIWKRRAMHARRAVEHAFFAVQATKMELFERRVVRQASLTAAVTELDARHIAAWGAPRVSIVENGVDTEFFIPTQGTGEGEKLLFLGAFDWFANQDCVEYLLAEILPLVLRHAPRAKLQVVGRKLPEALRKRWACFDGVELVGEVPDVRPYLASAAVVVVPLRIGGGSRIKILEAFAMKKAVVSTSVGAEGLAVSDGVHLLLADSAASFGECTIRLLASPEQRAALGESGRKLVEERYSWDQIALCLESAWRRICNPGENDVVAAQIQAEEVRVGH
jgi:glycosyltransferase involved in cell wall biosynthesis